MESLKHLDIQEISSLYIMYNELCTLSFQTNNYEDTLKYYNKILKYFELIYEDASKNGNVAESQLSALKEHLSMTENVAKIALEHLEGKTLEDEEFKTDLDEYENIFYQMADKEFSYSKIGELLFDVGANVSAINFLKKSLQINPQNYENYRMIADCYNKMDEREKAIAFYEKYDEHCPGNPYVYNALGALRAVKDKYGELDKQIKYFEKAIEILPNFKDAIKNLAIAYRYSGQNEKAMEYYTKLLEFEPTHEEYFNYACQKIKLGDFEEGWKYFEHRFDRETLPVIYPEMNKPRWNGENIEDKVLLVQCEQGFGDSIQFLRYFPQIKAKKILFRVQDALVELFKNCEINAEFVKKSTPLEEISFDVQVPLMSLPYLLKARIDNIPLSEGYIKADEKKVGIYKKKFFDNDCFKIGIAWHGAALGNEVRDISLEHFYPLTKLKDVKVYSFQKGSESELGENLPADVEITDLGQTFNDFSDTAAAMANVDLFITSDNVVFNLAGAMAKKTFLLLNRDSEWRWFLDEETTPWYDSVRIFKKKNDKESWDVLMQRVVEALEKY